MFFRYRVGGEEKNPARELHLEFEKEIPKLENEAELKDYLLVLLRFTPIQKIDQLVESYLAKNPQANLLAKTYKEVKELFLTVAPFFSRYSSTEDLKALHFYGNSSFEDLKKGAKSDIEYGEKRSRLAKKLYENLTKTPIDATVPKSKEFNALLPSSQGSKRAAYLLEQIAETNALLIKKDEFSKIRHRTVNETSTPIASQYSFAKPLIKSVFMLSKAKDVDKVEGVKDAYDLFYEADGKRTKVTAVWNDPGFGDKRWFHGQADLADTWKYIEDTFEKAYSLELKAPNDEKEDEKKLYQQQLTKLFELSAELVWLIGNTQPLQRGSGTFAELMLGIIFLKHNLQPPVLKLEFPQLDVLDITFPLSDYKKLLPYFFEPSTVPEHLRFPDPVVASLSIYEQLEQFYKQIYLVGESVKEAPTLQKK